MKNVNFVVNLLNIDGEHLGIPDTEYAATITMSSSEFSKNIHDLYSLAETVVIEASAGKITMSIEGDMGKGEVELIENEHTHITADTPVKLSFSLRYLNMFTKAASLSGDVTLGLLPDTPLVISYDLEEAGALKFYLAPKIND